LANGKLDFTKPAPSSGTNVADSYISDPAKPVPYLPRPIATTEGENKWGEWLMVDQRFVDGRPDVLTYRGEKLTQALVLSGEPTAHLYVSTTGTDADFVVKLIDVYPEEDTNHPVMGGYQLMIAADILRGRYRDDFSKPKAFEPGKIAELNIRLPHVNHVMRPGHRLMVQIQSTWFPLYDRNPQSFVENIFFAKPGDYQAQTHMIYHAANAASAIELPVVRP
jgi:putative CocE/NonD family hydrolase